MPKKYRVKKKTHEIQQHIISVLDKPMPLAKIAKLTSRDKDRISYHLAKMLEDGRVTMTKINGAPANEAYLYTLGDVDMSEYIEPKPRKTVMTLQDLIEKERREFKPKGAMANVKDAFDKLVKSSKLTHEDRVRALSKQRIGCGISEVYSIG